MVGSPERVNLKEDGDGHWEVGEDDQNISNAQQQQESIEDVSHFPNEDAKRTVPMTLVLLVAEDNEADNVSNDAEAAGDDGDQAPDDQGDVIIGGVLLPRAAGGLYQL